MSVILQQPPRTDNWREIRHWRQNVYDMFLGWERLDDTITFPGDLEITDLFVDHIWERTLDHGVNVDGVHFLDTQIGVGTELPLADIEVYKANAEIRVTDITHGFYSRIVRADDSTVRHAQTLQITDVSKCVKWNGGMIGTGFDLKAEIAWADFTVMFWAKGGVINGAVCGARKLPNDWFRVQVNAGNWELRIAEFDVVFADHTPNVWQHIAVVLDVIDDAVVCYVNGIQEYILDVSGATEDIPGWELYVLGYNNDGAPGGGFNGLVDEFRIYNYQVSAANIRAHYLSRTYETPDDPLLGYHFDDDLLDWSPAGGFDGRILAGVPAYDDGIIPAPTGNILVEPSVWGVYSAMDAGTKGHIVFGDPESAVTIMGSPVNIIGSYMDLDTDLYLRNRHELRFYDNGNYVAIEAPALAADETWTWLTADGNAGEVIGTNAAGALGWYTASSMAGGLHDGDTLELDNVNSNGGAFAFTTTGPVTFNQGIIIPNAGNIGPVAQPGLLELASNSVIVHGTSYLHITGRVISNTVAHRAMFIGQRARVGPAAVQTGDYIVSFMGQGYDGADYETGQMVEMKASENWAVGAHGSCVSIYTTKNASAVSLERLTVYHDGNVGIGNAAPVSKLELYDATFSGTYGSFADERASLLVSGTNAFCSIQISSTYNSAAFPNYGLVLVNGPDTTDFDVWGIMHDGPARVAGGLHFAYLHGVGAAANIHTVAPMVSFLRTGVVTIGTLSLASGSITDSGGTIDFGNEVLKTTGVMQAGDFAKTGWPLAPDVTLSFDNASKVFTVTDGGAAYYYIDGIKYTLGGNKTVDLDDVGIAEGLWYIYFVGDTLTASQTIWSFTAENKALVGYVYWDNTNNKQIFLGYEPHTFHTSGTDHARAHYGGGARWETGGLVSDAGAQDVNVEAGAFWDEDLKITITDGAGAALFEQVLSPAQLSVYYRLGATPWRIFDTGDKPNLTDVGYVAAGELKYNQFAAGVYGLTNVGLNNYVAMYVVETNEQTEPVALVMGQRVDNKLSEAKANNIFSGLDLTGLPFEEMVVLARLILKGTGAGVFYELEHISDLRSFNAQGNVTSPLITSHAGLGQLEWSAAGHYFDAAVDFNSQNLTSVGAIACGAIDCSSTINVASYIAIEDQNELRFYEGVNYVGFEAPALAADQIWILPQADGNNTDVLATDGAGTLLWQAVGAPAAHKDSHDPEDGGDPLDTAAAGVIQPDDVSAVGTAHEFARADHVHQIDCDTPNGIVGVQAGAEGTAYEFARSDHDHAIVASINNDAIVTVDGVPASTQYARWTGGGLAGRTDAQVLADLSGQAAAAFSWGNQTINGINQVGCVSIIATGDVTVDDLYLYDTDASHTLLLHWDEAEVGANRILNLRMGGGSWTLTMSGHATIADWFDQSVKMAAAPTFDDLNLYDTNASHTLLFHWNEDEAGANRTLNWIVGGADRTITLSGDPTLGDWFDQAVKQASNVSFGTIGCGTITVANGSSINLEEDITWTGATSVNLALFPNNLADALSFKNDNGDVFQKFISTTGALAVHFGQKVLLGDTAARTLYTATSPFQIAGTTLNTASAQISNWAADQVGASLLLGKSRSGTIGTSGLIINNTVLGTIEFVGADGTDMVPRGATIECKIDGTPAENNMPSELNFYTNTGGTHPTLAMTIGSSGNVGIGGSPGGTAKLYITGTTDVKHPFVTKVTRTAGAIDNALFFTDGNNVGARGIEIQCGEDVEAGTNIWLRALDGNGGGTGDLRSVAGVFQLANTSDASLKQNIVDTTINGRDRIMGLKVRDFEFIKNQGHVITGGFVAQEVDEVMHEVVGDPDPETGLLSYSRDAMVPTIIKHNQELQVEVEALEVEVGRLRELVEAN